MSMQEFISNLELPKAQEKRLEKNLEIIMDIQREHIAEEDLMDIRVLIESDDKTIAKKFKEITKKYKKNKEIKKKAKTMEAFTDSDINVIFNNVFGGIVGDKKDLFKFLTIYQLKEFGVEFAKSTINWLNKYEEKLA